MDSVFTIHKVDIEFKSYNEPFYLIPFGDIHRFAPMCYEEAWKDFLKESEKACRKGNTYFLGTGDYDDLYSESERFIMENKQLHESTRRSFDDYCRTRTLKLVDELKFMKGKLIGLLEGNHHANLGSGITTTQLMCEELRCQYLAGATFMRLNFHYGRGARQAHIDIWAHHGQGSTGGRTAGATINSVQRYEQVAEADIYIAGHDHQRGTVPTERLVLVQGNSKLRVQNRPVFFCRAGSFLAAYREGRPSYAVKKALRPANLGAIKIQLIPRLRNMKAYGSDSDETVIEIHVTV